MVASAVAVAAVGRGSGRPHSAVLGCTALAVALLSAPSAFLGVTGRGAVDGNILAGSPKVLSNRDEAAVARRVSPYYSNVDRERLARRRQEMRIEQREGKTLPQSLEVNYDKLPTAEDIYKRKFTGNADTDPIGGRMRYTYYVMFKFPLDADLKNDIESYLLKSYGQFLKYKMSCKNIKIVTVRSPLDPRATTGTTRLEYPMKEYGEVVRSTKQTGVSLKSPYSDAVLVKMDFAAPPMANEYIQKKIYSDKNILRFMCLGHTRTFKHAGEDNELFL